MRYYMTSCRKCGSIRSIFIIIGSWVKTHQRTKLHHNISKIVVCWRKTRNKGDRRTDILKLNQKMKLQVCNNFSSLWCMQTVANIEAKFL